MLAALPAELLGQVQVFLTRIDIARLSTTSKYLYEASLPLLYKHLELGYYRHLVQLQQGLTKNPILNRVIYDHTRKLTLRSRQNGNNWRAEDLLRILGIPSKIEELIFYDFCRLSTQMIRQIVLILPNLRHVQFKYCHIVSIPQESQQKQQQLQRHSMINSSLVEFKHDSQSSTHTINNTSFLTYNSSALKRVTYIWTDFTEKSIVPLLFPHITRLELGSNRNKYDLINDHMVRSLYVHCPKITHLTITLPQVGYKALCDTITQFGKQLTQLSVQCDHIDILLAIATHAINLQSLTLRINIASSGSTTVDLDGHSGYALTEVIEYCRNLKYFEVISCDLERIVPNIIWECCLLSTDYDLCFKAHTVLKRKRKKQQQKLAERPRNRPSTRGNVWFFNVTEEALEQRYHYMNAMGFRQKSDTLFNYTKLALDRSMLAELKTQIKILHENCSYSPK